MTISDRFKIVRTRLGLNQSDLAKALKVNQSLISDIERGDKEPSKKVISALIHNYKINSNWLLSEHGEMYIQDGNEKSRFEQELEDVVGAHPKWAILEERLSRLEQKIESRKSADGDFLAEATPDYETDKITPIPYVRDIAAGPPIAQSEDRSEFISVPARLIKKEGQYYAARIKGTSMIEAGIRDGDLVLIRYIDIPRDGAIQVVRCEGESTLKRLREIEGRG